MSRIVNILGATGSVGQSAVDIICAHPKRFDVHVVTAHTNVEKLAQVACLVNADRAIITQPDLICDLEAALGNTDIECAYGVDSLQEALTHPADITIAAITGMAGLAPLLSAMSTSQMIAIANKEPLVAAGPLVMAQAARYGCKILPLDSEHNAIFQVFEEQNRQSIERLILTASGGPFLKTPIKDLESVTPEQAIKHPNWSMGAKISVDSATMMNKALEIIEAHYLFQMPCEKIEVLIHPQSIIHSMVAYQDGSFLAQLGAPDMRTPIAYALGWPERLETPGRKLTLSQFQQLTFELPEMTKFSGLELAYTCLEKGAYACAALNAANEIAVEAFLNHAISYMRIMEINKEVVRYAPCQSLNSLQEIQAYDQTIRNMAKSYIV